MTTVLAEPISSTENAQVKLMRSLLGASGRRKHGAFLVEGVRLVEAAVQASRPTLALHSQEFGMRDAREAALLRRLGQEGCLIRSVTDKVLSHVSDTVTPQGIIAVVPWPGAPSVVPTDSPLCVVLDEVGDPGNAGTLLRSAAAAGAAAVFSAPGTVDLFSPKVVRAGAGAHFSVAVGHDLAWDSLIARLPVGASVYLADVEGTQPYWAVDWTRAATLIVSNEARGASQAARRAATSSIRIPMTPGVESLNAGVAGSIILFEALRQRQIARTTQ
jgi:RNA methyltransferase, TrmH family